MYFQTINQYHLWNVKKRYGVSHAGSGKTLAKIGSENGKYMVEFQADARVGFGKCIHFSG